MKNKIDDKAQYTEVYSKLMKAVDVFGRLSVNIPRNLCEVTQHIYGRFDAAAYSIFYASNTKNIDKKIEMLEDARINLFYQYSSLDILLRTKSLSPGAVNEVIVHLRDVYDDVGKWLAFTRREKL